jgi:hypothetical protein
MDSPYGPTPNPVSPGKPSLPSWIRGSNLRPACARPTTPTRKVSSLAKARAFEASKSKRRLTESHNG